MDCAAQFVEDVDDRVCGVVPYHARACVAHYLTDLLPLQFLVAVDGAVIASWFGFTIWTFGQAPFRVGHQFRTTLAHTVIGLAMVISAVDHGHAHECFVLALESAGQCGH